MSLSTNYVQEVTMKKYKFRIEIGFAAGVEFEEVIELPSNMGEEEVEEEFKEWVWNLLDTHYEEVG